MMIHITVDSDLCNEEFEISERTATRSVHWKFFFYINICFSQKNRSTINGRCVAVTSGGRLCTNQ